MYQGESRNLNAVLKTFWLPPQEDYTLVLSVSDKAEDSQLVVYRVGESFVVPVRGRQLLKIGETFEVPFTVD